MLTTRSLIVHLLRAHFPNAFLSHISRALEGFFEEAAREAADRIARLRPARCRLFHFKARVTTGAHACFFRVLAFLWGPI